MTTTSAFLSTVLDGVSGLITGARHRLAGMPLIFAVAATIFAAVIAFYAAMLALNVLVVTVVLGFKALVVAAVITGVYYAVRWIRSLW